MSTTVILNGLSYSIPAEGDANWGLNVSNYLIAIASACLQKTGGTYTLTAEVDFGATYGLKLSYVKSRATNPSSAGIFRLGNNESIGWRNAANTSDLLLKVNSSDNLEYNGTKVTLSGAIVDADISASAAITLSKLAALTASRVLVSDGSGVISASSVTTTTLGYLDATSSIQTQLNGKEPTITSLALNRLAAVTASRALASDASGFITASNVTNTELGYLSGVSSSVQTQLNGKANVYLSNLDANTTVNSTLKPQSAFTQNLGSSGYPWGDIYGANIYGTSDIRSPLIKVRENVLSSTKYVNINGPASMTASYDVTLPSSQGASNSVLTNDGSGNLTWVAPTGSIGTATGQSLVLAASSPTLNASAILQADSTTKGFLPPRMTQAQREAIVSPVAGLEIYNTDTNKLNIHNGTSWGEVGSGGGGINYITATDGTIISGWATYADAAGTDPVDGTGGSASVTFATSTNSDLRGTTNFLFTHQAANRQGQGFSYDFTIDKADQAKMLQIRFDYLVASGTYADGDLTVWVYDVTNSKLIQPAPYKILNAVGVQPWIGEFQTASDSTSYRLIFHVTTTTATAYTMRFDAISVGPQMNRAYGTPVTDWVSYTPTITHDSGTMTNYTATGKWRRVGDSVEVQNLISFSGSSGTWSGLYFSSPFPMDANKLLSTGADLQHLGIVTMLDSGVKAYGVGYAGFTDANRVRASLSKSDETYSYTGIFSSTVPITWGANDGIAMSYRAPIAGWSSNTVMSSDAATNVVAARAEGSTTSVPDSVTTKLNFTTITNNQGNLWDSVNSRALIPVSGTYVVKGNVSFSGLTNGTGYGVQVFFMKNGAQQYAGGPSSKVIGTGYSFGDWITASGATEITANAGDYIDMRVFQGGDSSSRTPAIADFSIERISGPAQIAASDTVAARYSNVASTAIGTGTTGTAPLDFATKYYDSHNAVTTGASWKFTAPISGLYQINAQVYYPSLSWTGTDKYFQIRKNGADDNYFGINTVAASYTGNLSMHGSTKIKLLAGEYIDLRVVHNESTTRALSNVGNINWIEIEKIGNY